MRLTLEPLRRPEILRFVNERIDEDFTLETSMPVGVVDRQGRLVAGWIWHNYDPKSGVIEFSGAADTARWMTRSILHELFKYAFTNAQMVITRNSETNTRLHRQLEAFGFSCIVLPRLFGRTEDCFYWYLTEESWCRSRFFISEQCHGQKIRSAAPA